MKKLVFLIIPFTLLAQMPEPFECSKIFEERKQELELKLEQIDEQRQAYEALKDATEAMLKRKEDKLKKIAEDLNATRIKLQIQKREIKRLIAKNEKLLKAIKEAKADKVSQTYAKMKASAAAQILSSMKASQAAKIVATLKPKTVGQILAKMDPLKASKITLLLEDNSSRIEKSR